MSVEAYPLCWPEGWPRTEKHKIEYSRFRVTQETAQNCMLNEIRKLGGTSAVLSTNIRLRQDGLPYASQRPPEDRGVAVYFQYKDKPMVFACDKYIQVGDNIHAIGKTIEALRGIERWGASDMMERAFTGFMALENTPDKTWREVLDYYGDDIDDANVAYKKARTKAHPDKGGSQEAFYKINQAWAQAERELG
ncbi:MAG: J domain-containing protein [Gammaproteobacteria bacterium]|nr:J domain-containing protein [Gammaproteobacteria bacterium]MCW8924087.1 J domain-containing protein [Gammaproteobacteria bacterium]